MIGHTRVRSQPANEGEAGKGISHAAISGCIAGNSQSSQAGMIREPHMTDDFSPGRLNPKEARKMTRIKIRTAIIGSLAAMMCGAAGCGGNSPALTPAGTVVNLSIFDSTFTGKPGSVALNYPSLTGTDTQGNRLSGSLSIVPAADVTALPDGTKCYSTVTTSILAQNGTNLVDETSTKFFRVSDGSFYQMVHTSSSGTTTYVRLSNDSFGKGPVKVGDSGNLGLFQGSDGTMLTVTWSLNPAYNTGSIFVISEVYSSPAMGMMSEDQRFYLDATGNPTAYSFWMDMDGAIYQVSGNVAE